MRGAAGADRGSRWPFKAALTFVWLGLAGAAAAETELGPVDLEGWLEVGGRISWGDTDASRFEDYRDLRDGVLGNFDLRLENREGTWYLRGIGENVGYRNQRYWGEGGRYGRFKINLFYGELPRNFSSNARTLFSRSGNEFTLPPGVQMRLEDCGSDIPPGCDPNEQLRTELDTSMSTPLELSWTEGKIGAEAWASESLLFRASYRIQHKEGERPFGIGFGTPGGDFITLPAPVDERIHEIRAGSDFVRENWNLAFDYVGNLFDNDFDSVTGANPLLAPPDEDGAPSRGRSSAAPDNSAHTWSLSGSGTLPLGFPNRLTANFAYGLRFQNDDFLPFTINSALAPLDTQPGGSLDGRVQTILGNLVAIARPREDLRIKLRGRVYDYDNQTDRITFPAHVENDTEEVDTIRRSVPNDYRKVNGDLDGSWDFLPGWTGTLGMGWEYWSRSDDREVANLNEFGPDAKLDYRASSRLLFQLDYRFRTRMGSEYGTFNFLAATEPLPSDPDALATRLALGQSTLLRKYDQADRDRHRASLLSRYLIGEAAELTLTGGVDYADYPDSELGLVESLGWNAGLDVGWRIHERVAVAGFYTYADERFDQNQLWRPRTLFGPGLPGPPDNFFNVVDSPLNRWDSETRNRYHDGGVRLDFSLVPDRLDFEVAWLIHAGRAKTKANAVPGVATAPPISAGNAGGDAVDWPHVTTLLNVVTATLSVDVTEDITLRTQYRFEDHGLDDFRQPFDVCLPGATPTECGSLDVLLGNFVSDYTAHVMGFSLILRF